MIFDLIIVGGGINGAGIARDAAMRGLKVLLLEKNDFAYGTSSRSTKLIHGGIRYLEHHNFLLVWEASHERKILSKIAPQLVRPLPFVVPVYEGDKRKTWWVQLGIFLYGLMAGFAGLVVAQKIGAGSISAQKMLQLVPQLQQKGLMGGGLYYDCQTDDARLTLANIQDAVRHGAIVKNYTEVVSVRTHESSQARKDIENPSGKPAIDVLAQDVLTAEKFSFSGRLVVNATGPWLGQNLKKWHLESEMAGNSSLRLTKGIHFFVPKINDDFALLISAKKDNRVFFTIPWGAYTLVGTTDTDYNGSPDEVTAEKDELEYLLAELKRIFPHAKLGVNDVIADFAGLRPLIYSPEVTPGAVSREYQLKEDRIGYSEILSVVGGKITTYRKLAERTTALVLKKLRTGGMKMRKPSQCLTAKVPLPGSQFTESDFEAFKSHKLATIPELAQLDADIAENLLETYGSDIDRILPYFSAHTDAYADPRKHMPARERIIADAPIIWAQLFYARDHEFARTPEDFIRRRTELYIHRKAHHALTEKIAAVF